MNLDLDLAQLGAGLSLIGIVLAVNVVGWRPAKRVVGRTLPTGARPLDAGGQHPPFRLAIQPPIILTMLVMIIPGELLILAGVVLQQIGLVGLAPVGALVGRELVVRGHRWWYGRRLRKALLPAMEALVSAAGGQGSLLGAWRAVTPGVAEPLRQEWTWMLEHLHRPYQVRRRNGQMEQRHTNLTIMLHSLAEQTPVRLHGRVLEHCAGILEDSLEHAAQSALRRIAAALARQASLQREIATQMGRIRSEAFVISGMFAAIAIYLAISQTERFTTAFLVSPWSMLALIWFGSMIMLPVVVALLIVRVPELPL